MHLFIIIFMKIIQFHLVCGCQFNSRYHDIKYYEFAKCVIVSENSEKEFRHREKDFNNFHGKGTEVHTKTASREFNLLLYEDDLFHTIPIEACQFGDFTKSYSNGTKTYEGFVKNLSPFSFATGYLHYELFSTNIFDGESAFIIKPVLNSVRNTSDFERIILYKVSYISNFRNKILTNLAFYPLPFKNSFQTANFTSYPAFSQGMKVAEQQHDMFCEVELIADHTLYEFFQKDTEKLFSYLYYHVKYADNIFRKTDFNFDGKPDGIRITVKKIFIYKTPFQNNYPMLNAGDIIDYLKRLADRSQDEKFCLSISFTRQNFSDLSVVGVSFTPSLRLFGGLGGICDEPRIGPNRKISHFNTAAINLYSEHDKILPLAVSLIAFTHELGHSFGSEHDSFHFDGDLFERHIMTEHVIPQSKQLEFSPYSRAEMFGMIKMKGGCLQEKKSVCGNLIREGDEECDCGWSSICKFVDPCCTPVDVELPKVGCKLKPGFECSRRESDCCLENCTIVRDKKTLCYVDQFLELESFCDGVSAACPLFAQSE